MAPLAVSIIVMECGREPWRDPLSFCPSRLWNWRLPSSASSSLWPLVLCVPWQLITAPVFNELFILNLHSLDCTVIAL